MKKLLLLFLLLSSVVKSQPSFFEKVFGDSAANSYAQAVIQLQSAKLWVATNNFGSMGNTIKLFGFDSIGNPLDTVSFATSSQQQQYANRMMLTDNYIYIAGYKFIGTPYPKGFILKADTNGNELWSKYYGDSLSNVAFQGLAVNGNSIFVSGYITNPNGSGNAMYVMKTDTTGSFIWDYIYNFPVNTTSDAIVPIAGGDVIASGDKLLGSVYTNFLLRLDGGGSYVWDFDIPNPYNNGCKNDFLSSGGDIYIVGESATQGNFTFDPAITKIDTAHNIKWSYIYSGSAVSTDAAMDMIEPIPENFLVTGYGINPANGSADIFMLQIDSAGNELNRAYIGDTTFDIPYDMIMAQSAAGCYIAGSTDRNGYNQNYLVYTNLLGITATKQNIFPEFNFNILPNPVTSRLTINSLINEPFSVSVYNITGQNIYFNSDASRYLIITDKWPSGIYILQITQKNNYFHKKIIKQ